MGATTTEPLKPEATVGRWTVLSEPYRSGGRRHGAVCDCRCACGTERPVDCYALANGLTLSCGCARSVVVTKHGMYGTKVYRAWQAAIQRCTNKNGKHYQDYGGRGIVVCERWLHSFDAFLSDMGLPPTPKHELDRFPGNDGNYEPGNCRWATRRQQCRNQRRTRRVTHLGETLSLDDWAERLGIPARRLYFRMYRGESFEQAIRPTDGRIGEARPNAKLNPEKVRTIRRLYRTGDYTFAALGEMFGVAWTAVSKAVSGETWKHVRDEQEVA